jgi:hypothetical protein
LDSARACSILFADSQKSCLHRWQLFPSGKNQPQKLDPTTEHRSVSTGEQLFSSFFVPLQGGVPLFCSIKILRAQNHCIWFSSECSSSLHVSKDRKEGTSMPGRTTCAAAVPAFTTTETNIFTNLMILPRQKDSSSASPALDSLPQNQVPRTTGLRRSTTPTFANWQA